MKVIDLLNKIANEEEIPKKIKYKNYEYWYEKESKDYKNAQVEFESYLISTRFHYTDFLNEEVEVIEDTPKEDKRIKKLKNLNTDYPMEEGKYGSLTNEEIVLDIQTLKNYINKIIDKINGEANEN